MKTLRKDPTCTPNPTCASYYCAAARASLVRGRPAARALQPALRALSRRCLDGAGVDAQVHVDVDTWRREGASAPLNNNPPNNKSMSFDNNIIRLSI